MSLVFFSPLCRNENSNCFLRGAGLEKVEGRRVLAWENQKTATPFAWSAFSDYSDICWAKLLKPLIDTFLNEEAVRGYLDCKFGHSAPFAALTTTACEGKASSTSSGMLLVSHSIQAGPVGGRRVQKQII